MYKQTNKQTNKQVWYQSYIFLRRLLLCCRLFQQISILNVILLNKGLSNSSSKAHGRRYVGTGAARDGGAVMTQRPATGGGASGQGNELGQSRSKVKPVKAGANSELACAN